MATRALEDVALREVDVLALVEEFLDAWKVGDANKATGFFSHMIKSKASSFGILEAMKKPVWKTMDWKAFGGLELDQAPFDVSVTVQTNKFPAEFRFSVQESIKDNVLKITALEVGPAQHYVNGARTFIERRCRARRERRLFARESDTHRDLVRTLPSLRFSPRT